MIIRAVQVRRFDEADRAAEALGMAARRLQCDEGDLAIRLMSCGGWDVTRVHDTREEFWVRHKASGKYLTTVGLRASLESGVGRFRGYFTVRGAKSSLYEQLRILGITWNDVTLCGE